MGDDSTNPVIAISAGYIHSLALKSDGTVWAWGENRFGQLGDGTTQNRDTPVQVSSLTNIIAIAAGTGHSVALQNDGTVWTFGYNHDGQLGNGSTEDSWIPVEVSGLDNIIDIDAGELHTVALKHNGAQPVSILTWGLNTSGQLGDNSYDASSVPVQVVGEGGAGFLEDIIAVHAGDYYNLALANDWSNIWAWGDDSDGQLGEGNYDLGNNEMIHIFPVKMEL